MPSHHSIHAQPPEWSDRAGGTAVQLADDLWMLDTNFQGEPGTIACYLLAGPRGLALIDVGSAASVEALLAGVRASGHDPAQIEHLVVTHVHLDHAGAAGTLVRLLPRAQVHVHRIGAPHLVDPSRLVSSAARIYGDRMQTLWGTIEPVPADRLHVVEDDAELAVGSRTLRALYTPGHAIHHIALYDAAHGDLFAGDLAGVRLQGIAHVRPPTPPPDLSLEDWTASLDRVEALAPQALYLAHFGPAHDVTRHLAELRARLAQWGEVARAALRTGKDDTGIAADLEAISSGELRQASASAAAEAERRYELVASYLMSAQGFVRYWRKGHPEALG